MGDTHHHGQRRRIPAGRAATAYVRVAGALALMLAVSAQPAVAGDSKAAATATPPKLAYVTGSVTTNRSSVWMAGAIGVAPRRLAAGWAPQLSPDGNRIAFIPRSGAALAVDASGGRTIGRFFDARRALAYAFAWSPDSRYLAVALQPTGSRHAPSSSLQVIDLRHHTVRGIAGGWVRGLSFAPRGPDRIVFGLGRSEGDGRVGPVDLYTAAVAGGPLRRLTRDGLSLNPLWTTRGIVFDRETLGRRGNVPGYQLWRLANRHAAAITHLTVFWLDNGLVPVAASADGRRLVANLVGQDSDQAWAVDLTTGAARALPAGVTAAGISRDGRRVLVQTTTAAANPSAGQVEAIPFSGGPATVLVVHAGEPSWDE